MNLKLLFLVASVFLLGFTSPQQARADVNFEFSVALEEAATPIDEATGWLFQVAWGHLDRTAFPMNADGLISVQLTRERIHEEILTHPVPEYFIFALEVPGQGWYLTNDIPEARLLERLEAQMRDLGSMVHQPEAPDVLVLPPLPERRIRVIDGDLKPISGKDVPLGIFLTSRNHCGGHGRIPLGRFVTDNNGEFTVRAPWHDLTAEVRYLEKEPNGWAITEGMRLGPKPLEIIQIVDFPERDFKVTVVDKNGQPVPGIYFGFCLRLNECGAGCGATWKTDDNGVTNASFVPETTRKLYIALPEGELQYLSGEKEGQLLNTGETTVVIKGNKTGSHTSGSVE